MSILPVSSSISSSYDSTELQKLKLKSGQEELSQKTENITENAAVESKKIESKSELSSDSSTVGVSIHGDTVEISKLGMSKAQAMAAAPSSGSEEQSGATGVSPSVSATSAASAQAAAVLESADTESSTESSTASLSSDSEYDLKQKLADGTITQSQYDNELKKRGKDTESV